MNRGLASCSFFISAALLLAMGVAHAEECRLEVAAQRIEKLRLDVRRVKRRATIWTATFASLYAVVTVAELALTPARAPEERVDGYVGAVPPVVGLAAIALNPPAILSAAPKIERIANRSDSACQRLVEIERLVDRVKQRDAGTKGFLLHIGNIALNIGAGALLGAVWGRWEQGGVLMLAGTVVGEIFVLTRPTFD